VDAVGSEYWTKSRKSSVASFERDVRSSKLHDRHSNSTPPLLNSGRSGVGVEQRMEVL